MTADRIIGRANAVAQKLVDDLTAGRIKRIGGETVEEACDESVQLSGRDRELMIETATRRVVELAGRSMRV